MNMGEPTIRDEEDRLLPGKLGEIEALLQSARGAGPAVGERAVLEQISRIISRADGGQTYQKPLG
ncbi:MULTISPECIES: hypothetical protein [unclassified Brevundimonas]|uniref:hypothetical protein n=1 Tax=unclassified Brevundimonas TaxID=2622653 RepID=UPI0025BA06F1|nr:MULTISPECIES: hypothetical protein [unclassified Brevundimonas]